jgi:hypothetical protein
VEGGGGGLTVSGVSRNRGGFVKCVAIQKRLGIPELDRPLDERIKKKKIRFIQRELGDKNLVSSLLLLLLLLFESLVLQHPNIPTTLVQVSI